MPGAYTLKYQVAKTLIENQADGKQLYKQLDEQSLMDICTIYDINFIGYKLFKGYGE